MRRDGDQKVSKKSIAPKIELPSAIEKKCKVKYLRPFILATYRIRNVIRPCLQYNRELFKNVRQKLGGKS